MKNHAEVVKQLLSAGSHVNYKTHEKMTPLHFAASRGFLELVQFFFVLKVHLTLFIIIDLAVLRNFL